jgi:transposase, IS6 family
MLLLASSVCGLFKWRQFEPQVILMAVGCYLRFSLSYREVEELLAERGLSVDHVTVWRWVQRCAPELDRRLRKRLKTTNDSWRVDETYVRVKGKWVYLYRAVDSTGATIDFLLSAKRDAAAAERFLTKGLVGPKPWSGRTIAPRGSSTPTSTLLIRQPAVFWKRSVLIDRCSILITSWNRITGPSNAGCVASQHFRSFWGAWRTIAGYEAIHMIRKGQAYGSVAGKKVGLLHRFILGLFAASN